MMRCPPLMVKVSPEEMVPTRAMSLLPETGWDTVLAEAKAAGIPVIIIDRMIDSSLATGDMGDDLFTCWIGSDFRKEGDAAVEWLTRHFSGQSLRIAVHVLSV